MKAKNRVQPAPRRIRSLPTRALGFVLSSAVAGAPETEPAPVYEVRPIGWVRKADGRTSIVLDDRYRPGLLGVDALETIWVLYWFDRNDTPEQRAILQVHPRGDPANPLRGVFATRAPVRPNLIALSRCQVLSVQGAVIEIDDIDAMPDTPVLDVKP
jgi:tRNA (adenine37-N6)-methyltransferase